MNEMRILSIIPPMTQLNTPYPSTAYLTGFLRSRGFKAEQADLSIALALELLSVKGMHAIHGKMSVLRRDQHTPATRFFAEHFESYCTTISPAIRFLQGRDPSVAHRIASRHYLPEGPRFTSLEQYIDSQQGEGDALGWAFGALGLQDRAKHIATSISMTSPTSSAMPSTRASSSCAMQNRWRRANLRSISCRRRSARRTPW